MPRRGWFACGIAALATALASPPSRAQPPVFETVVGPGGAPVVVLSDPPATAGPPFYAADDRASFTAASMGDGLLPDWPRWYAGATGLVMTRTLPNGATTTLLPGTGAVLTTSAAAASWPGGVDLHVGRWLGLRQEHAMEAVYWGVYGIGTAAMVTDAGNRLQAVPQAPGVTVAGSPAGSFLAQARSQQIARNDLVNNVELNWVYAPWGRPEFSGPSDGPVTLRWLAGFRFFQLQDVLTLTSLAGSVPAGASFGVNGGASQLGLNIATSNDIYGAQFGGVADWRLLPGVRLSLVKKGMIGGNAVTSTSGMATGNGVLATFADGQPVQVHAATSTFAYVAQFDAGLCWDITRSWSLSLGYRLVGVGNIAQSDPVWPTVVTGPGSLSHFNTTGSTLVHGAFAGFEGRY